MGNHSHRSSLLEFKKYQIYGKQHPDEVNSTVTFKRLGGPNRSGETKRHLAIIINSITLQKPSRPNQSGEAKGQSDEANKHLGGTKMHNEAGV